jgi:cohesin complex subunit SA-1/2
LWDDVIKQFMSHSSPITLSHANVTMQHFLSATLLSNTNSAKLVELEDELSTSLRDAVAGREELEVASFSEDEVHVLGAIASRLVVLSASRNMTAWMEEDEGGKQSSAWDIMNALAGRGRLGYKEEEAVGFSRRAICLS